jgi:hypothetical protein
MRVINKNLSDAAKVTEAWETFLHDKYSNKKETEAFRDYSKADDEQPTVTAFYKENHEKQSLQHVLDKKKLYEGLTHGEMGIWEALELMNSLVDESDPDTSLSQIAHALQSAEAARRDGQPRWMILTALIHDLGKYLFFLGEPQWTVKYIYISPYIAFINHDLVFRLLETLSLLVASIPTKLSILNFSKTIPIITTLCTRLVTVSTHPTVVWTSYT